MKPRNRNAQSNNALRQALAAGLLAGLLLACTLGGNAATAIPGGRPADFEVQTVTPSPTAVQPQATTAAEPVESGELMLSLGDAPTHTPDPAAAPPTPTATLVVTATVALTETATITPTAAVPITPTVAVAAAPTQPPASEPLPPLQGGDWDFEADYIPWANPHGEPCPGASVAVGWSAFAAQGEYGSSCFNENLYGPNVFSGRKSQEITFDFIAANSGIYRTIETIPGHRYNIVAYGKHDFSISPVELSLGVDLSGGSEWNAETVEWFPWDDAAEDTWVATEETVTATGSQITIFIRGFHPLAEQGGKTVIDNVSVTDLGL